MCPWVLKKCCPWNFLSPSRCSDVKKASKYAAICSPLAFLWLSYGRKSLKFFNALLFPLMTVLVGLNHWLYLFKVNKLRLILWKVWEERNARIFHDEDKSSKEALESAISNAFFGVKCKAIKSRSFSLFFLITNWKRLCIPFEGISLVHPLGKFLL